MTAAFLIVWILYTVHALIGNLRGVAPGGLKAQLLQTLLVLLALYWGWTAGLFTRSLWSPVDIGAGLLLGHVLFALALSITHRHLGDVRSHFADVRGIAAFVCGTPEILVRFLGIAAIEELVYRVAAQGMLLGLLGAAPAISVTAVAFCLLHSHFLKNGVASALEFLLFSLVIGVLYHYTSSFTLVLVIHLVRNVESAYLEYCVLVEDTHDEAEALRALRERHAGLVLESV